MSYSRLRHECDEFQNIHVGTEVFHPSLRRKIKQSPGEDSMMH